MELFRTIATSLVTSTVVSLFTFTIGLRAGKNQSDRAKHKEIYRNIYIHFDEIIKGIEGGKPKQWSDYPVEKNQHYPVVKKMNKDGMLLEISNKISKQCLESELNSLKFGYEYEKLGVCFKDSIVEWVKTSSVSITEKEYEICNYKNTIGETFIEISFISLFIPENIKRLKKRIMEDRNLGISFLFTSPNDKIFRVMFYPKGLRDMECSDFLNFISQLIMGSKEVNELLKQRESLLTTNKKLLKSLSKRARDPHSFWSTIYGAFRDIVSK